MCVSVGTPYDDDDTLHKQERVPVTGSKVEIFAEVHLHKHLERSSMLTTVSRCATCILTIQRNVCHSH